MIVTHLTVMATWSPQVCTDLDAYLLPELPNFSLQGMLTVPVRTDV